LAQKLGKNGKEKVKKHFLITKLISDYLDLFNAIIYS
jgi:hypothetical protein